jgi:hypothetical protein
MADPTFKPREKLAKPKPIGPRDEMGGREVESAPIEWFERGDARGLTAALKVGPWTPPKSAGPNSRGMSQSEIDTWVKNQPKDYCKGGKVISTKRM